MRATAIVHRTEQENSAETEITLTCREERISCWDAKQRVWKALDLIEQHLTTTQQPSSTIQQSQRLPKKDKQAVKSLPLLRPVP